jgi:uncharacterized protein YbjQ (UPF0145 family)
MKKPPLKLMLGLGLLLSSSLTQANDTRLLLPIAEAIKTPLAKTKLQHAVPFFFGVQSHTEIMQKLGTAAFPNDATGKTDVTACNNAFISAMFDIKKEAIERGANAVVNITSYYHHREMVSNTNFECHVDGKMATVSMKGDFVGLASK